MWAEYGNWLVLPPQNDCVVLNWACVRLEWAQTWGQGGGGGGGLGKNFFRNGNIGHIVSLIRKNGCKHRRDLHYCGTGSLSQWQNRLLMSGLSELCVLAPWIFAPYPNLCSCGPACQKWFLMTWPFHWTSDCDCPLGESQCCDPCSLLSDRSDGGSERLCPALPLQWSAGYRKHRGWLRFNYH